VKVRISYVVNVDREYRKALNSFLGRKGIASRRDIKQWYMNNGSSRDDDIMYEYEKEKKEEVGT
jgi:hypothetical protein